MIVSKYLFVVTGKLFHSRAAYMIKNNGIKAHPKMSVSTILAKIKQDYVAALQTINERLKVSA